MEQAKISRLTKDLKEAAQKLSPQQARYLVDQYYQIQGHRIATAAQARTLAKADEPGALISYISDELSVLERQIQNALHAFAKTHPVGRWMLSICGIGPVISAGLLAHIDITRAPTAGHIWSFAGLTDAKWQKGQKRPWNAALKVLCFKIGQSFVKVSNNPKDFYGAIYKERKAYEQAKNDAGDYAKQAAQKLRDFKIGKDTDAYKAYSQGKLPSAHIQQRAERYATKLFLAHLQGVWYEHHYNEKPPKPYAIGILGHGHEIFAPNWGVADHE